MTGNSTDNPSKNHFIYKLLNPKSVCVLGANNNLLTTMGSMQLRNIIAGNGVGDNIYPIHPTLDNVQGFKAYKSILDLPDSITPELAFMIIPPKYIPDMMQQCGIKGIKNLIITSGGFREIGDDGAELSKKIKTLSQKYGIRFIGPNCLGVYNGWYGYPEIDNAYFHTHWVPFTPKRGNVSIASQSGTIASLIVWHTNQMDLRIGKSISVGNENNIDLVDFLEFFRDDPQTEVIGLYIEEIKRGREFKKLAKEISVKKPIVAIYAGGSEGASRSIMSHTGSIGGNQKIYDALFKETGIIATNSVREFLFFLRTFSWAQRNNIYPKGNRVALVGDSGGASSMMAKTSELYGLKVPEFSKTLQRQIHELIPPTASALNPVDLTFDTNFQNLFVRIPKMVANSGEIDSIMVFGVFDFNEVVELMVGTGYELDEKFKLFASTAETAYIKPTKRLIKKSKIPIFYIGPMPFGHSVYKTFFRFDVPIFETWDEPTKCMSVLTQYYNFRAKMSK